MKSLQKLLMIVLLSTSGILFSVSNSFGIDVQTCIKYDSQVTETFKKNWVYKNFPEKTIQNYLDWLKNYKVPYKKGYTSREVIDTILNQCVALYGKTGESQKYNEKNNDFKNVVWCYDGYSNPFPSNIVGNDKCPSNALKEINYDKVVIFYKKNPHWLCNYIKLATPKSKDFSLYSKLANDFNICSINRTLVDNSSSKKQITTLLLSQLHRSCDGNDWINSSNTFVNKSINFVKNKGLSCDVSLLTDDLVCYFQNHSNINKTLDYGSYYGRKNIEHYINEAKRRGLDCTVGVSNTVIVSKSKTKTYTQPKATISSVELDAERQKRKDLERKLAVLENKQKQEKQRINTDNQEPTINAFTKLNGSNAIISGRVTDNTEVAEILINGQTQQVSSNGTFETKFYIPRTGKTIEIVAFDTKGNKASKLIKIERGSIAQASGPIFDTLNPSSKTVKSNPNALALIIGISDYSKTNANAIYADKDAQQFYDYATMKLGIPARNVKELVNDKADLGEIGLAVQDWIARSTKKDKSDIYIFFAGHGLASDDGKNMYLLPYDGRPRLLDKTALLRDELFKEIQQSNPRSVTVFLDTCYSGTTRGTDMLIASRPIAIRALEQSIPNNFTVFSAAAGDQTSKPLEEAKHGMFSYFLMKGMEGDADTNGDNKITARELHAYVEQNVTQQSSGSQTPELQGDKDRVLVQFN